MPIYVRPAGLQFPEGNLFVNIRYRTRRVGAAKKATMPVLIEHIDAVARQKRRAARCPEFRPQAATVLHDEPGYRQRRAEEF